MPAQPAQRRRGTEIGNIKKVTAHARTSSSVEVKQTESTVKEKRGDKEEDFSPNITSMKMRRPLPCLQTKLIHPGWLVKLGKQLWIFVEELLSMKMGLRWTSELTHLEVPHEIASPRWNT